MNRLIDGEIGNEKTAHVFKAINGKKSSRIDGKTDSWRASLTVMKCKSSKELEVLHFLYFEKRRTRNMNRKLRYLGQSERTEETYLPIYADEGLAFLSI